MPHPQNLPALIKEMQERARAKIRHANIFDGVVIGTIELSELDASTADTANTILEYVKGVVGEMSKTSSYHGPSALYDERKMHDEPEIYNQALTDLIARLTSNPE